MFGRVFSRLQSLTLGHPKPVLLVCLLLVGVAAWLGSEVEFRSARSELAPRGDADQRRWESLLADYQGSEAVVACVEAAEGVEKTDAELERFADRLGLRLAHAPGVARVFHKLDVDWLLETGPHLIPVEMLQALDAALRPERRRLQDLAESGSLADLNRSIAAELRAGSGETEIPPQALPVIGALENLLRFEADFLEDPQAAVEALAGRHPLLMLAEAAGRPPFDAYLRTHDGKTLLLLISPRDSDDSLRARRALLSGLREEVGRTQAELPGVHVAFTGTPAMTVEEMDIVRRDTWRTSIVAILGVSLLTLFVFRWKTHALLVLVALAVGLVWSFGAVQLELGYLNMITSAFISTLVGVGVAYGIHPVSEYELCGAHTKDPVGAVREAFRRTGTAVAAAGFTTSVAFFSILLMRFRGFAELGVVAGVGVLLCLLAAMVFLPAILVLYGLRRQRRDTASRERSGGLDRLWLERVAGSVCCCPRVTVAGCLLLTGLMGWAATGLSFNTNILDLLPENAESLQYQRRLTFGSDVSPVFNFVVADNLDELRTMRDRALDEPAVSRFESALSFVPEHPEISGPLLREWSGWVDSLGLPPPEKPVERTALAASLAELEELLAEAADDAFVAGVGDLAGALEGAREQAERAAGRAAAASDEDVAAWNRGQQVLREWVDGTLTSIAQSIRADPPSIDELPEDLRGRFFTRSGKPLGFLFPTGSVFDPADLEAYVDASWRVSETAIGFPFMFHKMSQRITAGFYRAVTAGGLLVFLILLIDLRSFRSALLAAMPLAVGLVWALGGMRLLGLSFDFANLVAVPLIVGVGIDNGVHMIHRVRLEGREGIDVVLRHTGRAILISSLTTMIGFGSLVLASHRGLSGLGLLLILGVGSCLVASTLLLPNLLVVCGLTPPHVKSAKAPAMK